MSIEQRQVIPFKNPSSSMPPFSEIDKRIDRNDNIEIAKSHIDQSGFPVLALDCVNSLKGEFIENSLVDLTNDKSERILSQDSFYMTVVWNESIIDDGEYLGDAFIIEGLTNGTIIVHGNFGGSTVLRKEEWFSNPKLQIAALDKAKRHPMPLRYLMDVVEE